MGSARLLLYDDPVARNWHPFSPTRPVGEMLFGTETLRARIERVFAVRCRGHLAGDTLLGFEEAGAPACTTPAQAGDAGPRVCLNSRFVPDEGIAFDCHGPSVLVAGRAVVGVCLPDGMRVPRALPAADDPPDWPIQRVAGRLLNTVWELLAANGDRIRSDGERFPETGLPSGVHRVGSGRVSVATDAVIEPGVVFDTSGGPIIVSAGTRVQGPARVAGPLHLGRGSSILGGFVEGSSIGPSCRIRGEVGSSVLLGFANKAHDGFLGHSMVGRWVNLGAMTSNSDLKNTYGTVHLSVGGRRTDTGLLKLGCLLGDHVRTGIGTLLNTGTVVGAGSHLFGGGMPPRDVPPFSWGDGTDLVEYELDRFLETAAIVMARRGVSMTAPVRNLYRRAFDATAPLRNTVPRR